MIVICTSGKAKHHQKEKKIPKCLLKEKDPTRRLINGEEKAKAAPRRKTEFLVPKSSRNTTYLRGGRTGMTEALDAGPAGFCINTLLPVYTYFGFKKAFNVLSHLLQRIWQQHTAHQYQK
ncbi:hypothetical protein TNCV_315241 [Trichonephila clavipes]|nr:hypothetical protein TNCV_315241 [Trichonephila clavipes]